VILIDGTYQGVPGQKIVYATSQNLTMTSLRESNEVMLRIPIPSVYQAYLDNFVNIRSHAVRVTSKTAAQTTGGLDSARETGVATGVLRDNSADPDE
jgi:phosphatidylserine/phosphatidylglycerophosphate/cardiolipin synthase-like enzyme